MDPPEDNPSKRVKFDIRPERRRQAPAGQRQEQKLKNLFRVKNIIIFYVYNLDIYLKLITSK